MFGQRLKQIRDAKRLSQEAVARAAGMTRQNLSEIEKGNTSLSLDNFVKICRAMDENAGDILGTTGDVPIHPKLRVVVDRLAKLEPERLDTIASVFLGVLAVRDDGYADGRHAAKVAPERVHADGTPVRIFLVEDAPLDDEAPNVSEDQFIEGDYDYPRPLHAWIREETPQQIAAGPLVESLMDDGTRILHSIREATDERVKVIKVNGESMYPRLHHVCDGSRNGSGLQDGDAVLRLADVHHVRESVRNEPVGHESVPFRRLR